MNKKCVYQVGYNKKVKMKARLQSVECV
jgi:hypothetical protein